MLAAAYQEDTYIWYYGEIQTYGIILGEIFERHH